MLERLLIQFERTYAPQCDAVRDIGETINRGLTENIRRLSMVHRAKYDPLTSLRALLFLSMSALWLKCFKPLFVL